MMSSNGEISSASGFGIGGCDQRDEYDVATMSGKSAVKNGIERNGDEEGDPLVDTEQGHESEKESKLNTDATNQNDRCGRSASNNLAETMECRPAPPALLPNESNLKSLSSSVENVDLGFSLGSLESPRPLNKRREEPSSAPSSLASAKKRKISSVLPIKSLAEALQPEFWQESAAVSEHNIASASFDVADESGGSSPFSVEHGDGLVVEEVEVNEIFLRKMSDEDKIRIMQAEDVMRVASLAAEGESPPVAVDTDAITRNASEEVTYWHVRNGVQATESDNMDNVSSSASLLEESNRTMREDEYSRPLPPAPPSTPAMSSRDIFTPLPFQSQCDLGGGKISFSDEIRRDESNGIVYDPFDAVVTTPPRENTLSTPEEATVEREISGPLPTRQKNCADLPIPDMSGSVTEPRRGGGAVATQRPVQSTRFDFEKWDVGDRYQLKRLLGRGSYGEVAQAIDLKAAKSSTSTDHLQISSSHSRSAYVAVKRICNAFDQETDAIRLFRELHILRRLRGHACVIQLFDVVQPSSDLQHFNNLYLVFEYVDTDLYKLIMSPQYLTAAHIQTFLYQMLVGLKYIHSSSVIHRDLKPAILVNEDCTLKICDFGLARIVQNDKSSPSTAPQLRNDSFASEIHVGTDESMSETAEDMSRPHLSSQLTKHVVTRWYRAPELILIQPYGAAVDIWSTGCIFGELLSMQEGSVQNYQNRVPLFPGGSCYPLSRDQISSNTSERLDQLNVIFSVIGLPSEEDLNSLGKANEYANSLKKKPGRSFESLYPAADPAAIDLLKKMLMFNPSKRCTAEEALEHEFLKPVRRKEVEICAMQPLVSPKFLETSQIGISKLKEETYKEVLSYSR